MVRRVLSTAGERASVCVCVLRGDARARRVCPHPTPPHPTPSPFPRCEQGMGCAAARGAQSTEARAGERGGGGAADAARRAVGQTVLVF